MKQRGIPCSEDDMILLTMAATKTCHFGGSLAGSAFCVAAAQNGTRGAPQLAARAMGWEKLGRVWNHCHRGTKSRLNEDAMPHKLVRLAGNT